MSSVFPSSASKGTMSWCAFFRNSRTHSYTDTQWSNFNIAMSPGAHELHLVGVKSNIDMLISFSRADARSLKLLLRFVKDLMAAKNSMTSLKYRKKCLRHTCAL